ncbi:GNAT family N-acetyltransferase [Bacillus thuringiensis]|uniref:GNAT family N-acetyltransferase n=1 Tax=Bacillus thuringiensis TaxID=1428 RepID=UPI00366B311F
MDKCTNISFKNAEESDLGFLFELYTSDEVVKQALSPDIKLVKPENLLHTVELLKEDSNGALYIASNLSKPIGIGVIYDCSNFHQRAKIGISLSEGFTNKGYGSLIFDFLMKKLKEKGNIIKVSAEVFEYNPLAMGFIEKKGFINECTFKKHIKKNDQFFDFKIYSTWLS